MYSDVSGNVTLMDDTVFVADQYEVPADVGPSTGDIEYDGCVVVKGNVLTGYAIKATGDITVNGVVEGASLTTDGKIVLKRGIQGKGEATLQAGGDVISNFIESANVTCGGKIMTEAIMHSKVTAEDDIVVKGKRGMIAGGYLKTKTKIEAKTIGSTMGTLTELQVGIDPKIVEQHRFLEKEVEQLTSEREGLMQNVLLLKKRMDTKGKLDDEKMASLKKTGKRIQEIDTRLEENAAEREVLEVELNKKDNGRIIAENIVYPGVKMTISNVSNTIKSEVQHSADQGHLRNVCKIQQICVFVTEFTGIAQGREGYLCHYPLIILPCRQNHRKYRRYSMEIRCGMNIPSRKWLRRCSSRYIKIPIRQFGAPKLKIRTI